MLTADHAAAIAYVTMRRRYHGFRDASRLSEVLGFPAVRAEAQRRVVAGHECAQERQGGRRQTGDVAEARPVADHRVQVVEAENVRVDSQGLQDGFAAEMRRSRWRSAGIRWHSGPLSPEFEDGSRGTFSPGNPKNNLATPPPSLMVDVSGSGPVGSQVTRPSRFRYSPPKPPRPSEPATWGIRRTPSRPCRRRSLVRTRWQLEHTRSHLAISSSIRSMDHLPRLT